MPLPQAKIQTVTETPTQKIVSESRPKKTVVDSRGRTIIWRTMSILDQAKLYRAVGAENSKNQAYMNLVNVAGAVLTIDGEIGPIPTTMLFAEMRVEWLGDEGYEAILDEVTKEAEARMAEAEVDLGQQFRDNVKN